MRSLKKNDNLSLDIVVIGVVAILLVAIFVIGKNTINKNKQASKLNVKSFNKSQYSISNPNSVWVIVNKQRPISPLNFIPQTLIPPSVSLAKLPETSTITLQPIATQALSSMFLYAKQQKINLFLADGYKSYNYQQSLYDGYSLSKGTQYADDLAFRPGYNESQIGLTVDISNKNNSCYHQNCFDNTVEGKWLLANAYRFGFILRYPKNDEKYTGMTYEPWLFRYVGYSLSSELYTKNQPLEQFFNLPSAISYK